MRRFRSHDQPRLFWAKLALALGVLALVPLVGAASAVLALAAAALGGLLHHRRPSRYGGRPLLWTAVALAAVGLLAFVGEASLFLRWKTRQAEIQKDLLSRQRLTAFAGAVENYRLDTGFYPSGTSREGLAAELVPTYASSLPETDAWERPFLYESDGVTCALSTGAVPDSGSVGGRAPRPPGEALRYDGAFPAVPPEAPPVGPPAPWPPNRSSE